jgi:DNA-directed RNA polymerase subunit RPC12/RpoP
MTKDLFYKFLCRILGYKYFTVTPILGEDTLYQKGRIDYKCRRCGKITEGYFYQDRFRTLSWSRVLTQKEKDMLLRNPYCFLKRLDKKVRLYD